MRMETSSILILLRHCDHSVTSFAASPGSVIVSLLPMSPPSAMPILAPHNGKTDPPPPPSNSMECPAAAGDTTRVINVAGHGNVECLT